ncbi:MAG: hypothetical protein LLG24_08445 [Actinomycetia bacterium]|nr:hypothetical protein [Actinomycetes bacterium]
MVLVVVIAGIALGVSSCGPKDSGPAFEHPGATTVEELLTLRAKAVRERSAYAKFFEDPKLADALAQGTSVAGGAAAIPDWKPPYVSAIEGDKAEVVVRWVASERFPGWPEATVFVVRHVDGRWVVVDALDDTAPFPKPASSAELEGR